MAKARNGSRIKIKQPPVLFGKTQQLVKRVARRLDGTLITYWNNPGGCVCGTDVIGFYQMLEKLGRQKKVYLFLKSNGGNGKASLRIVNLLRRYADYLVALVPLECASAATMVALGANEIRMGPLSYLTAVDTSLVHDLSPLDRDNDRVRVSLDELKRVVTLWNRERKNNSTNPFEALFQHVHPLVVGAVDRADSLSTMLCQDILSYHIKDAKKAQRIANSLNTKYPSHSYPILLQEAKRIGLKASELDSTTNDLLLDLNEVYSEMGQRNITDYDESRYHNNEILNIIETIDLQLYYQVEKDWFYRQEERRWAPMNDQSTWRRNERVGRKIRRSRFHVA